MTGRVEDFPSSHLLSRAQRGDTSAFEGLYRRHHRRVYGICLRMLREPELAHDLAQEVFLRVWRKLGTVDVDANFKAWLNRVTVNAVISYLRSQRRWREAIVDGAAESIELTVAAPEGRGSKRMDLDRAVAQLPEQARMVFLLFDVEGRSHAEIADLTGLSIGACKSHLHRARKRLQEILSS